MGQHAPATGSCPAGAKSMAALALDDAGLKGTFHRVGSIMSMNKRREK
jgi:hypothetical protein